MKRLMNWPLHTRDFSRECAAAFLVLLVCVWYNLYMDKIVYFSTPKDVTHGRVYVYSLQYRMGYQV